MERHDEFFKLAEGKMQVADHMATMTYPLVKDPKVLLLALENIFLSMSYAVQGVLSHERLKRSIPAYSDTFEGRISTFRKHCAKKYPVPSSSIELMRDLKSTIAKHKDSPIEFAREGKFVICSADYEMKVITYEEIKKYISVGRDFVKKLHGGL